MYGWSYSVLLIIIIHFSFLYCLKNEHECIMRFQNSRLRLEFLNLAINIHCMTASFLNGFKISDIDQLILELIFRVV